MAENRGTLVVNIRKADGTVLQGATVILTGGGRGGSTGISNAEGDVTFSVLTPSLVNSLTPNPRERPYASVDLRILVAGYVTVNVVGEQIFTDETTRQNITMGVLETSPSNGVPPQLERVIIIPTHHLSTPENTPRVELIPETESGQSRRSVSTANIEEARREVVIPETIRVHLGPPGANAEVVTVPFIDYIKNVACSEIYPTWPENSIIANVISQVSLALNRLYTEWYPSQGYDFDITNSTAYDQYYVHERGIFDKIDTIVDGYFTNYISRENRLEPLFAEYCDGATTTCDGLSQWGTVSLARRGYIPLQILRYYFGEDIEIREAETADVVPDSFPGALQPGDASPEVATLQNRLNRIAISFPAIPFVLPPTGRFDTSTATAVRAFQRLFRLEETGVVDRETWYRIQYIYTAVKKLAELESEGEFPQSDAFNGRVLQEGSRGNEVLRIQNYLAFIANAMPDLFTAPTPDGIYGNVTRDAVLAFQNYYGLVQTGTVNEATWNGIVTTYFALGGGEVAPTRPYPGTPLRRGSTGDDVSWVQTMLNTIAGVDLSLPTLTVDGIFGAETERVVRQFQQNYGLSADGIVGPLTWDALTREYERVTASSGN